MRRIKELLPFVLAGFLLIQLVTYIGLYQDYSEYRSAYKQSRDAMLLTYIEGGDASDLQAQTAHLKATADLRLRAMEEHLWKTAHVMTPIVVMYGFVFILSLLPERTDTRRPRKKKEEAIPYMEKGEGEIIYDERTGGH